MGRNTKWIESRAEDPVQDVARRALETRLERVWHYLERSADEAGDEIENVHLLRVFSRRAAAALDLFEPWLPPRRGRWMRRQIKRVRRAAGDARDCDVLLDRWRTDRLPVDQQTVLVEEIRARRAKAQKPVDAIFQKLDRRDFERKAARLIERIRAQAKNGEAATNFGALSGQALARLVGPYLLAGDAPMDDEALHAFRIQGKQVRYALETFAGAFEDDFRQQLYPVVVLLQDKLGAINDHVTAEKLFAEWKKKSDSCAVVASLEAATAQEQRAHQAARQEFLDWWSPERRRELRQRFARYVPLPNG